VSRERPQLRRAREFSRSAAYPVLRSRTTRGYIPAAKSSDPLELERISAGVRISGRAVELKRILWLFLADSTGRDVGFCVDFRSHGHSRLSAQYCKLPNVRERVGDWSLKQLLRADVERRVRRQMLVEGEQ